METHDINNTQNSNLQTDNLAAVENPGHSQAQGAVQASVEQYVQKKPGPDEAFATMRLENERLAREAAELKRTFEVNGVREFLAQKEASRLAEEAHRQNLSVDAVKRIEEIEQRQNAFVQEQQMAAAANNLQSFARQAGMDKEVLSQFANWMDTTYPDMANIAASNSSFDFSPYSVYFAQQIGATPIQAQQTPTPVYIPGHGSATSTSQSSEHDKMMAIIRERVKD